MPMVHGLDELTEFQGEGDLALMPSEVMRCKKHFDTLVITPIDKSRFWVEKGAWKHREKHVVFLSAIDVLGQVHKV